MSIAEGYGSIFQLQEQIKLQRSEITRLRQRVAVIESLETKHMKDAVTIEDWRQLAEHYEYQWRCCSDGFNKRCGELRQRVKELEEQNNAMKVHEWQWQHVAATTLARFVNHGAPEGDEKWAEIADVAIKLLNQPKPEEK